MSDYTTEQLNKAFDRAKLGIILKKDSTFLSTILFSLKFAWNPAVKTGEVDGELLEVNPDWFMGLNPKQRMGALAHYAWHVAFEHNSRIDDFPDKDRFNKAADYVNNILLKDAGYDLPDGFEYDSAHKNMSTDEVYKIIDPPKQPPQDGSGSGDNQGQGNDNNGDGNSDGDGGYDRDVKSLSGDSQEVQQKKDDIKEIIEKAATRAKMEGQDPGNLPGEVQRMLEELHNPKLDWKTILQNYMNNYNKEDYSWRKPNRRFMPEFYLPSLHSEAMGHLSVLVDTSCSVGPKEFAAFRSEINSIKETLNPTKLTAVSWDTRIANIDVLTEEQTVGEITFAGGGGTDIRETIQWLEENNPEVAIIFTDGYFHMPDLSKVKSDIIWVIYDNNGFTAPSGKVIEYELGD